MVKLPDSFSVTKGDILIFSQYTFNDDTYVPKKECIRFASDPSIYLKNEELFIADTARIPSESPFPKTMVLTENFGLAEIPTEYQRKMEKGVIYNVEITPSIPKEDKVNPVFKVVSVVQLDKQPEVAKTSDAVSEDEDSPWESRCPTSDSEESDDDDELSAPKHCVDKNSSEAPSEIAALVVSIDNAGTIVCYSRKLRSTLMVKLPKSWSVRQGQVMNFSEYAQEDNIYTPKEYCIRIGEDSSCRVRNNKLIITVSADIRCDYPFTKVLAHTEDFGNLTVENECKKNLKKGTYDIDITPTFSTGKNRKLDFTIVAVKEQSKTEEPSDAVSKSASVMNSEKIDNNHEDDDDVWGPDSTVVKKRQGKNQMPTPQDSEDKSVEGTSADRPAVKRNPLEDKPGMEHRAIILDIKDDEIICYSITQLKLVTIDMLNIDVELEDLLMLRYMIARIEDERIFVSVGSASVSPFEGALTKPEDPIIKIETFLIFSKHFSDFKSIIKKPNGFSETYGVVSVPPGSYALETLYKTIITVNQCSDSSQPVFLSVSPLVEHHDEKRLQGMMSLLEQFEERLIEEMNKKGMLNGELMKFTPRELLKQPKREHIPGFFNGLVISMKPTGRYSGKIITTAGVAFVNCGPVVNQSGETILLGNWVDVLLERRHNPDSSILLVNKIIRIKNGPRGAIKNVGQVSVRTNFDAEPAYDDNSPFYRHKNFGLVFARNHYRRILPTAGVYFIHLEKAACSPSGEMIHWAVEEIKDRNERLSEDDKKRIHKEEQLLKKMQTEVVHVPQPTSKEKMFQEEEKLRRDLESGRASTSEGSLVSKFNYKNRVREESAERSSSSEAQHNVVRNRLAFYHQPDVQRGVLTKRYENASLVFLFNERAAAVLFHDEFDELVRIGNVFECEFRSIPLAEETLGAPFEITRITHVLDSQIERRVWNGECQLKFEFNLARKHSCFPENGAPRYFSYSSDVGFVMLRDEVLNSQDEMVDSAIFLPQRIGLQQARRIVGYGRFIKARVPRMAVDATYDGPDEDDLYIFHVIKILGTKGIDNRVTEIDIEDLGEHREEIERLRRIEREGEEARRKIERLRALGYSSRYDEELERRNQHSAQSNDRRYHDSRASSASRRDQSPPRSHRAPSPRDSHRDSSISTMNDAIRRFNETHGLSSPDSENQDRRAQSPRGSDYGSRRSYQNDSRRYNDDQDNEQGSREYQCRRAQAPRHSYSESWRDSFGSSHDDTNRYNDRYGYDVTAREKEEAKRKYEMRLREEQSLHRNQSPPRSEFGSTRYESYEDQVYREEREAKRRYEQRLREEQRSNQSHRDQSSHNSYHSLSRNYDDRRRDHYDDRYNQVDREKEEAKREYESRMRDDRSSVHHYGSSRSYDNDMSTNGMRRNGDNDRSDRFSHSRYESSSSNQHDMRQNAYDNRFDEIDEEKEEARRQYESKMRNERSRR